MTVRILIDIVHPADVLFFQRPIRTFVARGDAVTVASREKDVACALLDRFSIPHVPLSRTASGVHGLAGELLIRDVAMLRLARRVRPQVMLGFGGVSISHVGWILGIPSVAFYDHDPAWLQTRLTFPFITHLTVPEDYDGPVPGDRTDRLPGTKDLSYFHPNGFRPDRSEAVAMGLDPDRPNVFLRFVRWSANHDIGKNGWSDAEAEALAAALAPVAKLHVSAEARVPAAFSAHLWRGDPVKVHHLLGCCNAYVGESATMACEAVSMGVPAIYAGVDFPGYVRGLAREGLLALIRPKERGRLHEQVIKLMADRERFSKAHASWITRCPDWSEAVVARVDRHALPDEAGAGGGS